MVSKYITPADTAKELRKALKEAFPGIKFSVRTNTYAGGASINVRYTDGPNVKQVEEVAKQFEGSTFDGMTDMKSHHKSMFNGELVHWGSDYSFVDRDISPEIQQAAKEFTEFALASEGRDISWTGFVPTPQEFYKRFGNVDLRCEYATYTLQDIAADAFADEKYDEVVEAKK